MKRKKGLKRTGFRWKTPNNKRTRHATDREEYMRSVHRNCELCGWEAREVHHIVHFSGSAPEIWANYIALCRRCHVRVHAENLMRKCIEVKIRKGEWLSHRGQLMLLGKAYTDENWEWI